MTEHDATASRLLADTGDAIIDGVERTLPGWLAANCSRVLDAWRRLDDPASRADVDKSVADAVTAATARVVSDLRALFATALERQRVTPLQIVRTAYREPTDVLAALGVPDVRRDEFEERTSPDDRYGFALHTLGDLDPDLGPLQLAWGLAKAKMLRAGAP
jgi:hypothetical protein